MSVVFRGGVFVGENEALAATEKAIMASGVVARFMPTFEDLEESYVEETEVVTGEVDEDALAYGDDLQVGPAEVLDGDERDGEAEEPQLTRIEKQMEMSDEEFMASVNEEYYMTEAPAADGISMQVVGAKFRSAYADRGVGYNSYGGDALSAAIDGMAAVVEKITTDSYKGFCGEKFSEVDAWLMKNRLPLMEAFFERMPTEVFTGSTDIFWFRAEKKDKFGEVVLDDNDKPIMVDVMRPDACEDFVAAFMSKIHQEKIMVTIGGEKRSVEVPLPMDVTYQAKAGGVLKTFEWSPWRDIRSLAISLGIDVDLEGAAFQNISVEGKKVVKKKMKVFCLALLESLENGIVDLKNLPALVKATNGGNSYVPAIMGVFMGVVWKTNSYYYAFRRMVSFVANKMSGYIAHRKAMESIHASEADYLIMDADKLMKTDNREWEGWQGTAGRKSEIAAYNAIDNWIYGQQMKDLRGYSNTISAKVDGSRIVSVRTGATLGVYDENDEIHWNLRNHQDVRIAG